MLNFVEIGRIIVVLRERKGLTQEKLALEAEMSVIYLRRIERGRANPTLRAWTGGGHRLGLELSTVFCCSPKGRAKITGKIAGALRWKASPHA